MAESSIKIAKSIVKRKRRKKEGKCVSDMCTKADPSISSRLQDPLWWVSLCLPLKNLKDEVAGQLKININYLWQIMRKGGPLVRRSRCQIPEQSYLSHKENPKHRTMI
jgi:hypothetical protein